MTENGNKYRVYLDGGDEQGPYDPRPSVANPQIVNEAPFCLGIVGDFSGRGSRGDRGRISGLDGSPLHRVTPENVLDLAGISPKIVVRDAAAGLPETTLSFAGMGDFHPDSLFDRLPLFQKLRDLRDLVRSGETPEEAPGPEHEEETASGLLDAVLGETEEEMPTAGTAIEDDLDAFIRRVVKPHVVKESPDHSQRLAELDEKTGKIMAALLHSSEFRGLESLWRSVVFLLSHIEVSTKLRIYLIDVSREELSSDLLSTDEPTDWEFADTILSPVSERGEGLRWAALLGAFELGSHPDHISLLQRLGLLAELAGVPWFSQGAPNLLGTSSLSEKPNPEDWTEPLDPLWLDLRGRPESEWLNLTLPDFLLRTPYGPDGVGVRRFNFSEPTDSPQNLLWGCPSVLWGVALARAFARSGWALSISRRESVPQVPLFRTSDGDATSVRVRLSHTAAMRVTELGLTPMIANRNEPEVHLLGMGSVSTSGRELKAWWKDPT